MITVKNVREWLQTNLVASGRTFAIFSDVAEFKKAYKPDDSNNITRYVNAILEPLRPNIFPIKNLQVGTQSFNLTIPVDIDIAGKDSNGNYIEVDDIKKILTDFAQQNNGVPFSLSDDDNLTFEITPQFNGVTNGIAEQISPLGNFLPVELNFTLTMVESGLNSNNIQIILNGEDLFFESASFSRTRMAETNSLATDTATKTAMQSNSFSVHINAPLLSSTQSLNILNDNLSGGLNKANTLTIVTPYQTNNYIVTFGNNNLTLAPAKNVGNALDLVEITPAIADFSGWTLKTIDNTNTVKLDWAVDGKKTLFIVLPDTNEIITYQNTTDLNVPYEYTFVANGNANRKVYFQNGTLVK